MINEEIIEELFKDENWYGFHDVVYDATGVSCDVETLKEFFRILPKGIQLTAAEWGLSDSVFRDDAYEFIITNALTGDK